MSDLILSLPYYHRHIGHYSDLRSADNRHDCRPLGTVRLLQQKTKQSPIC